jgi:hypothetical protein
MEPQLEGVFVFIFDLQYNIEDEASKDEASGGETSKWYSGIEPGDPIC